MPTLRPFAEIFAIAAGRKGGSAAFEQTLVAPKPPAELAAVPDDRWLAGMSRAVFNAGFNWKVIEAKWPGFEEAFHGFDPGRCALISDAEFDALMQDRRIVRNGAKVRSVVENAALLTRLAREHGSAARFFTGWPTEDYAGLLAFLKKNASQLGGTAAQYFLRFMGVDSFVLSKDVVRALIREGVVAKAPGSQRDLADVQAAFNRWRAESGRPLNHISRTLACSVE